MSERAHDFVPTVSAEEATRIQRWHERAYASMRSRDEVEVSYLGLDLTVPPTVFAPTPMSDLFGRCVLDEVRASDRVLDMGTGSGSNAILAAATSSDVLAVDINPAAVECARRNAEANGVAARVEVRESDLFDRVDGRFDLILFDPPYRWFPPRDLLEAAITDEGYDALSRFVDEAPDRLRDGGRVLLAFGTSGDLHYLISLYEGSGLHHEVLADRTLEEGGWAVAYYVYRLRSPRPRIRA